MKTINNDIMGLNEQIEEVTDCFYQQKIEEGYEKLEKVYPLLIDIIDKLSELEKDDIKENINNISDKLRNSLIALENKDIILLSDIMRYELLEELNCIANKLT